MIKIFLFALFVNAVLSFTVESKNNTLKRLSDSDYYISSQTASFLQAWAFCENYGMKFISFGNNDENAKLLETIDDLGVTKPAYFWVGGFYIKDSLLSKWYWVDGEDFVYSNFYSSGLVTGDNCIRWDYTSSSTTNGKWYAGSCSNEYNFVCKR